MSKLYFEDSCGLRRLIGTSYSDDQIWRMMYDFCAARNFIIPYVRTWSTSDGEKYYDVGSHTEFFVEVEE